jgi:hypothetical protein
MVVGASPVGVPQLRPDANVAAEYWMRPAWLQAAMALDAARRTVLVAPWIACGLTHSALSLPHCIQCPVPTVAAWHCSMALYALCRWINGRCYSWSDGWALVPRQLARRYFNLSSDLSCAWLACVERSYGLNASSYGEGANARDKRTCLFDERIIVEWLLNAPDGLDETTHATTHATSHVTPHAAPRVGVAASRDAAAVMIRAAPAPHLLTNATGWCEERGEARLPGWLEYLYSRVRGVGHQTVAAQSRDSPDAALGPIGPGSRDPRWTLWHRPLLKHCAAPLRFP